VARQLQPSVVYIGDAERTFVKKVPKTDKVMRVLTLISMVFHQLFKSRDPWHFHAISAHKVRILSWEVSWHSMNLVVFPYSSPPLFQKFHFVSLLRHVCIVMKKENWFTLSELSRPLPSCLLPLCQNESSCENIHMKMCSAYRFILM